MGNGLGFETLFIGSVKIAECKSTLGVGAERFIGR